MQYHQQLTIGLPKYSLTATASTTLSTATIGGSLTVTGKKVANGAGAFKVSMSAPKTVEVSGVVWKQSLTPAGPKIVNDSSQPLAEMPNVGMVEGGATKRKWADVTQKVS